MFNKKLKEGYTYYSDSGEAFLVLEGAFSAWELYLQKNQHLKNGKFECRMIEENDIKEKILIQKGIYKISV